MAKLPDPIGERLEGVKVDGKVEKIRICEAGDIGGDVTRQLRSTKHIGYLGMEKVRGSQSLALHPCHRPLPVIARVNQSRDNDGRIDYQTQLRSESRYEKIFSRLRDDPVFSFRAVTLSMREATSGLLASSINSPLRNS